MAEWAPVPHYLPPLGVQPLQYDHCCNGGILSLVRFVDLRPSELVGALCRLGLLLLSWLPPQPEHISQEGWLITTFSWYVADNGCVDTQLPHKSHFTSIIGVSVPAPVPCETPLPYDGSYDAFVTVLPVVVYADHVWLMPASHAVRMREPCPRASLTK